MQFFLLQLVFIVVQVQVIELLVILIIICIHIPHNIRTKHAQSRLDM